MLNGYPDAETAEKILEEAEKKNPGPWVQHSRNVAQAAKNIAECCPGLNEKKAFVLGLLHDIGRREGTKDTKGMDHVFDGYRYCMSLGFNDCARICITHSFPSGDVREAQGPWGSEEYCRSVGEILATIRYDDYDRLIQLCDAVGDASGFCLIEKRLIDVALRNGVDGFTQKKWKAHFSIKDHFETIMGKSIYTVLPGAVENTFPGVV